MLELKSCEDPQGCLASRGGTHIPATPLIAMFHRVFRTQLGLGTGTGTGTTIVLLLCNVEHHMNCLSSTTNENNKAPMFLSRS